MCGILAHYLFDRDGRLDEQVLRDAGVTDLGRYAVEPGHELAPDFFL